MRLVLLLCCMAGIAWPRTAYDCRYYDCVTPFQEPVVALPAASSIPQPAGGPLVSFDPRVATVTGWVFGFGTTVLGTGPFLSDGVTTRFIQDWPDFHFLALADDGLILACETCDAPFLTRFQGLTYLGPAFNGPFVFRIGASGTPVAMNHAGTAILVAGVNQFDVHDVLVESGLRMMFADTGFTPTAIPEPATALLCALALGAVLARRA